MVVTRKAPAPPPTARANTSQSSPRKKANSANSDVDALASPLSDGGVKAQSDTPEPKKGKQKSKGKQKKGQKKGKREPLGFVDLLARVLLLWFTIYTLSVCPEDDHLKSPVCRGLYHYRRLVLEPYIFPPIQNALAHPSVAPYVDAIKPAYNAVSTHAQPVLARTQLEWRRRVVPQWKKRVLPQYRKRVVPRLRAVEHQLEPYIKQIEIQYEKLLAPYVRFGVATLNRFGAQAQPYVILAAHKSHEGFTRVKPYARPAWEKFTELVHRLLAALAVQRRKFVDPHVAQIWEKVKELSGTTASKAAQGTAAAKSKVSVATTSASTIRQSAGSKASSVSKAASATGTASEVLPRVVESPLLVPAASSLASSASSRATSATGSVRDQVKATALAVSSAASSSAAAASSIASNSANSLKHQAQSSAAVATDAAAETASSASIIGSAQAAKVGSSALSSAAAAGSTASAPASAVASAVSSAVVGASSSVSSAAAKVSSVVSDEADDFLAQLGLSDDPSAEPEKTPEPQTEEPKEDTEEEKARRLAAVAKKRADITARHTRWEHDLDAAIAEHGPLVRSALARVRTVAATELERSVELRAEIDALVNEADKFLNGAEGYLKNLAKEERSSNDKLALWRRVVDKVEEKFTARLSETENTVNGWYLGVVQKENAEIERHADAVREVADAAQADLGLGYTWLEDVTYHDWQRYHDLANKHKNFIVDAQRLQNGTHPDPLENTVIAGIAELEGEVKDIVVGFETRLRRIKRAGDRTLASTPAASAPTVDNDPVPTPEVSILPVPEAGAADAPPPVVIGRGRQEIIDAIGSIEKDEQTEAVPHGADDATKSPEAIVGALAHEAEVERDESVPLHKEL